MRRWCHLFSAPGHLLGFTPLDGAAVIVIGNITWEVYPVRDFFLHFITSSFGHISIMAEHRLSGLAMLLLYCDKPEYIPSPEEMYERKLNWRYLR